MGFSAVDYVLCLYNKILGWFRLGKIGRLCLWLYQKTKLSVLFFLKCLLYFSYFLETSSPVNPHSQVKHGLLQVLLYICPSSNPTENNSVFVYLSSFLSKVHKFLVHGSSEVRCLPVIQSARAGERTCDRNRSAKAVNSRFCKNEVWVGGNDWSLKELAFLDFCLSI